MPNLRARHTVFLAISACLIGPIAALADPVLFPAAGVKDACVDSPLKITFDAAPTLGAGKIEVREVATKEVVATAATNKVVATIDAAQATRTQTIGGLANYVVHPVLITGKQAVIALPPGSLRYARTYEVTIDAGVFAGTSALNWQFSTKEMVPRQDADRYIVSASGEGDFATVQGAIDFIPEGATRPCLLFIRSGTYNEILCLMNRNHLTLLGEDRKNTILAYPNNDRFNPNAGGNPFGPGVPQPGTVDPKTGPVYRRGLFLAHRVTDLTLANLTLHNTTPKGGSQAETIIFNGSPDAAHLLLTNLDLLSFQDTIQINGQAYINDSYIEGDVDFMWGTGPSFFQNVHARALTNGAIFTTVRCPPPPNTNHGFVFKDCTLDGAPNVTGTILARIEANRFPTSETILLNTTMSPAITPAGWRAPTGGDASSVHYWEYNSHDDAGTPIDITRRLANSKQLSIDADKATLANYSDPTFVLNPPPGLPAAPAPWTPALAPLLARSPADASTKLGSSITLQVEAVAIPAPSYQWQKNGAAIPGATQSTLKLEKLAPADAATYTVLISNPKGKVTSPPAKLTLTP